MSSPSILYSNIAVNLKPSPIAAAWIVAGTPVARNMILSRSRDGTASTMIWDCTAGTFDWHYDVDETVHFLEGSVVVCEGDLPPRKLGAGDVAFFPAGSMARWHIETYVRKIAFLRRTLPKPIGLAIQSVMRARNLLLALRPARLALFAKPGA